MKVDFYSITPKRADLRNNVDKSHVNFGFSFARSSAKNSQKFMRSLVNDARSISDSFFMSEDADIVELLKGIGKKQRRFLRSVARRYSDDNYYTQPENRENVNDVLNLFKDIKKPNKYHYFVLSNMKGSFSELKNVFFGVNKRNFNSLIKLNARVSGNPVYSKSIISDIFASPNKNKYINNFDKYSSYFALNKENKNAVAELDELVKSNKYSQLSFDSKYNARLIKNAPYLRDNQFINEEFLEKNYSSSAETFMDDFMNVYMPYRKISHLSIDNSFDIMQMYKTANPDNLALRYRILKHFRYSTRDRYGKDNIESEITEMRKLFDKIDNNKYVADFLKKFITSTMSVNSIRSLNALIDTVGAKKANVFFDNFIRLVNKSSLEEQIPALKRGIEDPFFETKHMAYRRKTEEHYRYRKPIGKCSKAIILVGNFVNKVKYRLLPEEVKYIPINSLAEANGYKPAKLDISETPLLTENIPQLNLVGSLKLSPKAKRLMVVDGVNSLISKELSSKTFMKQSDMYKSGATAMRLKLLPEIFSSIKETRKADLSVGKRKGNPVSGDALSLYNRINGKNRKLVRYLLTKRNADDTRMFEVKDIVAIIDKAEKKIKQNNYNSVDAKKYYEKLYLANVQMYGKPNLRRKTSAVNSSVIAKSNAVNELKPAV